MHKSASPTLSLTKKNRLVLAGCRTVQTVAVMNPLKKLGAGVGAAGGGGIANPLMSSCFAADILCTC